MAIEPFFPFVPDYMSWEDWNGNMAIYFDQEPLPIYDELNWKKTVTALNGLSVFSNYPIPDPELFETWQDWAREFTTILNGPSA